MNTYSVMTVRTFLIGATTAAIAGSAIWLLIVYQLSPRQAGVIEVLLFFLSLFVALTSICGLLGYGVRRVIMRSQFPAYTVRTSLRQGVLVTIFIEILLTIQLLRLYHWWIAVGLVVLFGCLELVFLSYDRSYRHSHQSTQE